MPFNSYTFLLFFGIVLGAHSLLRSWRQKKLLLLVASYIFYAAWNPPFVLLLWISTVVDWFCASWMHASSSRTVRRACILLSLLVNLGLLAFFKYCNFFLENFVTLLGMMNISYAPPSLDIVLPVGISFYSFQTLSYTIDIYRGAMKPWSSPLDFALYVTFFPQLVAGPIVRASEFLPQCSTIRKATGHQFAWGMSLFVLGLFEKVVIADGLLAPMVEQVFSAKALSPDFIAAWSGTLAFAGQIFCDFAGYSTCAIGIAMCLGFELPDNFRFPYAAIGFSDFWGRWHRSLSSWLRDYLYIPLGGNRRGAFRTYVNLSLTMLIGGLWHGASWTFVVWGGLHGLLLIIERAARATLGRRFNVSGTVVGRITLTLLTFAAICVTWVFFRADTFDQAFSIASAMFGVVTTNAATMGKFDTLRAVLPTASIVVAHVCLRDRSLEDVVSRLPSLVVALLLTLLVVAIVMMPGEDRAFIYFQF